MDLAAPGLENKYVRLEPLDEAHREPLRTTDALSHMWESMPAIQRGAGFDTYFDFMVRAAKANEAVPFIVVCSRTNKIIGATTYLLPVRMHRRVVIGYTWIDGPRRGQGIFPAVQALLIKRAVMWGARRIGWHIETRNERALKAITALGAVREGTLRNYARFADGCWVDIALFSMLRDEAKDVVLRLEAALEDLEPNEA